MTNVDKAVEAILSRYSIVGPVRARASAQALEEAGLLMPDLPEPSYTFFGAPCWGHHSKEISIGRFNDESPMSVVLSERVPVGREYIVPEKAREYAYKILAAADYAEKEQDND